MSAVSSTVQTFHRENRQICMYFFVVQYVKHFYQQQYCKGKCKSVCTFYRSAQPRAGGRAAVFNHQQEQEMCDMFIEGSAFPPSLEKTSNDCETTLQGADSVYVQVNHWCEF